MPDNKYLVTPDSHQGVSHITPARLATLHRGTIAQNDYVLSVGQKFKTEIISNNVVRVYDGALIQGGIRGEIEQGDYRDVEISNGIIGMKRNYLIVCRWSVDNEDGRKTHQEIVAVEGAATEGEPQDPETNTNLIEEGAQIHDTVLYRVVKEGLDIVKIDPLFKVLMNVEELMEMQREINSKIDGNITSAQSYVKVMGDSYVKKIGNKVSLQIVAQSSSAFASGTKYHIADIPAEFRPKRRELTAAFANSSSTTGYGVAYMEIDVSGAINVQFATQAKNLLGHLEYFL